MKKLLLIPIIVFILSLISANAGVFISGAEAHDMDIAILDENTGLFVTAWCDDTDDSARYQVFYSNGTAYNSLNEFDASAGNNCRISVSVLNKTSFVIGLADDGQIGATTDWVNYGYDIDDNTLFSAITIDTDTNVNVDVGICALNSTRYASVFIDDLDDDATYVVYDLDTEIVGQTDIDIDVDPQLLHSQMIDCSAINDSAWIVTYGTFFTNQNSFVIYDAEGVELIGETAIGSNADAGSPTVAGLTTNKFVTAYCDSTDDDVSFTIHYNNGSVAVAEIDVDTTITSCATASGTRLEVTALNTPDGQFSIIYDDATTDEVYLATYNSLGDEILAPTLIDSTDLTDKSVAIVGYDVYNGKSICNFQSNPEPLIIAYVNQTPLNTVWKPIFSDGSDWDGNCIALNLNQTNLDVFLSKNPIEILEQFTLFANYTNTTDNQPVLDATCFANSTIVGGGDAGFGRGITGIGGLSTIGNAVHTQVPLIYGNNTLRVDIQDVPLGKASYGLNFRFHAHTTTPLDDLRVYATCHNNLTFSNFTFIDQVNTTDAVVSTSDENNTIWGFRNIVLFGTGVASENCSVVFESINSTSATAWDIADTISNLNLDNSYTSDDFGETYTLRPNANERSPFIDLGFGLDVPSETTMIFNSTSGLYQLSDIRHGRPFDFNDIVFCSADNFESDDNFIVTNVEDNVAPLVQINSISPDPAIQLFDDVTIIWIADDVELLESFINVTYPNGTLLIKSEDNPLIIDSLDLSAVGTYSVTAFGNDTTGLSSTDNDIFTVTLLDLLPPNITLIEPSNNTINNTFPMNISFTVADNGANDITCTLTNSTFIFDDRTQAQGSNYITLQTGEIEIEQNFPNLNLSCYDNDGLFNNSASMLLNYSIDNILPVITVINPPNNEQYNKVVRNVIDINGTCFDNYAYKYNITITNSSETVFSVQSMIAVNNIISIDETLNILTFANAEYIVTHTCYDIHTKRSIPDYTTRKNTSDNKIKWTTPTGNEFELKYSVPAKNPIHALSYGTYKQDDRYVFYYIMNISEGTEREFVFELKSRKFKIDYIEDSPYNAHFIMGNNWLDFELDDENATYKVTMNDNNNYEIEIITTKNNLTFSSVGELNTATEETTFTVFAQLPREDAFILGECPINSIPRVLMFMFFILLGFIIITMGYVFRNGLIGTLGSMMLIGVGVYTWFCLAFVSMILMLLGLTLMSFFIFKGVNAFK